MEKIILVRHAHHQISLTERGIAEARGLAEALKAFITFPIALIASPAPRTKETAQILVDGLSTQPIPFTCYDFLEDGDVEPGWIPGYSDQILYETVSGIDHDIGTLLVVTHSPVIDSYANYYLKREFGCTKQLYLHIHYAEAVSITTEDGNLTVIRNIDGQTLTDERSYK